MTKQTITKEYLEKALDILENAIRANNTRNDIERTSWISHLRGYLQGGIELLELRQTFTEDELKEINDEHIKQNCREIEEMEASRSK